MITLAAGSLLDADAVTVLEAAMAAGFDGVGLRLSADHAVQGAELDRLARAFADTRLMLLDVEVHRITTDTTLPAQLIDTAAALGARHLLVVSDLPDLAATEDRLGAVSERCRTSGLRAALEYMAWTTPSDPGVALDLAAATDSVVVCDLLHHLRVGATADDLIRLVDSGRLGWVQLCDAPATQPLDLVHEARHARLPPGDGELPLADLLLHVPLDVPFSVEVQSDDLARRLAPAERAALLYRRARAVIP
jgi:sugar phosphate isomerase/epimerase